MTRSSLYFVLVLILLIQLASIIFLRDLHYNNQKYETSDTSLNFSNPKEIFSNPSNDGNLSLKLLSFQSPSILFLVGNEYSLNTIYDIPFYNYMSINLGFNVVYHTANDSYDYTEYDAIVISKSVAEEGTAETLTNATIPILTMEAGTGDEFSLGNGAYGGESSWFSFVYIPTESDLASSVNHYIVENEVPGSVKEVYPAWEAQNYLKGYTAQTYPNGCETVRFAYKDTKYAVGVALEKNDLAYNLLPAPERRVFWGITEADNFLSTTWDWWKKALYWTLYDDLAGNATINVNVQDLDGNKIEDAIVNLTDSVNTQNSWIQNTTILGSGTFSNIPWGQYNIEVSYRTNFNNTLTNLQVVPTRTYMKSMTFDYSVIIDSYIDEEPPIISNVNFNKTTSTFLADITDFSDLAYVYLNLTAHNLTTGSIEIPLQNFSMILYSGVTYYNTTALDTLSGSLVNITYNIIAADSVGNFFASPIRYFDLDDPDAPIVWSYNAIEFGNGQASFYANITDISGIQPPVIIQINSDYFEMYQNESGFWLYHGFFAYGIGLDYTIFSVFDQVGNENGSTRYPLKYPFKSITPTDFTSPRISMLSDTFSSHEEGYVEFDVNIDDWNSYQSGINASSVQIILEINGENHTLDMVQIGEITFSFEHIFSYNDSIRYWIKVADFADNLVYSVKMPTILDFYHINDNTIPDISFWAFEYGNGTLDFYSSVIDWPNNDTRAFILFTGDYFATEWTNYSMIPLSNTLFWFRYVDFPYQEQDIWYYVTAFDSENNTLSMPLDSAKSLDLSDSIAPDIILTLINSTTNDGWVDIYVRAIDHYGPQIFVNNTFYINITSSSGLITKEMTYDSSFYPFSTYNCSISYPYQEEILITIWVSDISGNTGIINKTVRIVDVAPPDIVKYGVLEFQNGTIIIWAEVLDGYNGSGLLVDNSSVILNWAYIHEITVNMEWNGTGNYFCYKITKREPRDAITYNITVIDNANNIASTGLLLYKITDKTAPIFVVNPSYNEVQINHITTEVTFWTVAYDPFGDISEVILQYAILEDSSWMNFSTKLNIIDDTYLFTTNFLPNTTLQFRIIVFDEWLNNVTSNYTILQLTDFTPATFDIDEYGIEYLSSESGKIKIWTLINDPFHDHKTNVSLTVTDLTKGESLVINSQMTQEGENYSFYLNVEYQHNYSIFLTMTDLGVFHGYYPAETLVFNNVHLDDQWAPQIFSAGHRSLNSTTFLFWANITDWGSGVQNVTLFYTFEGGIGSQLDEEYENILMTNNGSHYIAYLYIRNSGRLYWNIVACDQNFRTVYAGPKDGSIFIADNTPFGVPLEILALIVVGTIIILCFVGLMTLSFRKKIKKSRSYKESLQNRLSFFSNTYSILVSSSAGLPVLNITNILYQTDDSMDIALSGLSVGIDAFLESFQSDFMNQIYSRSESYIPQQHDDIKVSLIEQNEVKILILGSETFRIFVFLRENPSKSLRTAFINIIRELEQKLRINEMGIIDNDLLGPQVHKILSLNLPVNLLRPFKIDLQKIKYYDQILTKGKEKSPISREALDALKILAITTFSSQTLTKNTKSLLKLCDEHIQMSSQRYTGVTMYNNARIMISKFIDFPIELEYEVFWKGTVQKVNILVPHGEI